MCVYISFSLIFKHSVKFLNKIKYDLSLTRENSTKIR